MDFPADLKYTEHDEWIRIEGDVVTLGITDYAQDALGELVHVELPDVGTSLDVGDAVCEVESVKAVAEVYTPVAGEVVEVNESLGDEAEVINEDPYGSWLVKIRVTGDVGAAAVMDADTYRARVESA